MRILVLGVGKTRESFYREGCDHYLGLIRPLCPVELVEGEKERSGSEADRETAYSALRKRFMAAEERVVLSQDGRTMGSEDLARHLARLMGRGIRAAAFLVGGPHGLPAAAGRDALWSLSLSPLTLPHQMARLVLLEQVYRALSILRGGPYHK